MKALVTGAGGFLGSCVVSALLERGHAVRALLRPSSGEPPAKWQGRAEIVRADLRALESADGLFDGVDTLVHLAANTGGSAYAQFTSGVVGTEKLLDAMCRAGPTRRLVLASSFSVYDKSAVKDCLTEDTPLEPMPYERDGYAIAKFWQERVARRFADENDWTLTVLRPGLIYGPGRAEVGGAGLRLGRVFLVIAPLSRLPLTHVENCAAAFVDAAEKGVAGTFNIIDDERISAWRCAGSFIGNSPAAVRLPVPYALGLAAAHAAKITSRLLFPPNGGKLPSILIPRRYRARFKPLRFDNRRAKEVLGWKCKDFFATGCDVT